MLLMLIFRNSPSRRWEAGHRTATSNILTLVWVKKLRLGRNLQKSNLFADYKWSGSPKSSKCYNNTCSTRNIKGFNNFIKNTCFLPPPPDVRRVEWKDKEQQRNRKQGNTEASTAPRVDTSGQSLPPRPEISNLNTTLIGDYISVIYPEYHQKWLVQAFGNATFQSTLDAIIQEKVIVNRRYIFLQLGGNQIRMTDKEGFFKALLSVVLAIRDKNPECHIFVAGILPRPVENQSAKPLLIVVNRWLRDACERITNVIGKVVFIPVQLSFIGANGPCMEMFNEQDKLTLSIWEPDYLEMYFFSMQGLSRIVKFGAVINVCQCITFGACSNC